MLGDLSTPSWGVVFIAWQFAPALLIWRLRSAESLSLLGTIVAGTAAPVVVFESSTSSTGGLIFLVAPLYVMSGIFVVFAIELTMRAALRRRGRVS